MFGRFCRSLAVAGTVAAFASIVHAQTASSPAGGAIAVHSASPPPASAVVAAWHAGFSKGWNPPKTPWGDPDLQGNFTWVDEVGTPFERPAPFEGRNLTSVTQAELAALTLQRQESRVEEPEPLALGIGPPNDWYHRANQFTKNARPWSVLEPVDGKIPPLTAEAAPLAAAKAAAPITSSSVKGTRPDTYLDWNLDDRCILGGGSVFLMTGTVHGNHAFLVQTPDYVVFHVEELLAARVIPIKGRNGDPGRLPYELRPYWGDSVAWFEGNTLVVETVYHAKSRSDGEDLFGAPPETTRTIERFTRRTAPDGIEWTATIDNPTWWVRPWTWQQRLTEDDRQVVFEYACHENNHAVANALAGARDAEKREGERAKRQAERAAQGK